MPFPVPGRASSVSFVRGPRSVRHTPERIILVTARRIPFAVFSLIPYNRERFSRQDLRREGRRRHVSGPRPLSAISDGLDPFALMGVRRLRMDRLDKTAIQLACPRSSSKALLLLLLLENAFLAYYFFLKLAQIQESID